MPLIYKGASPLSGDDACSVASSIKSSIMSDMNSKDKKRIVQKKSIGTTKVPKLPTSMYFINDISSC